MPIDRPVCFRDVTSVRAECIHEVSEDDLLVLGCLLIPIILCMVVFIVA